MKMRQNTTNLLKEPNSRLGSTITPLALAQPFSPKGLRALALVCVLAAVMTTACTSRPTAVPAPTQATQTPSASQTEVSLQSTPGVDQAPKGTANNPLVQVFVPSGDVAKIQAGAEDLDKLMEDRGVTLRSSVAVNYAAAIDAMCAGRADIVWMTPLSYVIAKDRCPEAQLLLTSVRFGSQFYAGQILVRSGSGIDTLEDLNGKTFAFTDPASASGYLYPVALLEKSGVKLGRSFFAGSHPAAALAVVNGTADAAATVADIRNEMVQDYPDIKQATTVLARTEDIPNDTITAGPNVSPEVADTYRRALLEVASSEEGKKALAAIYEWEGVSRADESIFDPVRQAVQALGIDLQYWKGVSEPYRVGLVTGIGNVEDGTLNQSAYEGMMRAASDFNIETAFIETVQNDDFEENVELFAKEGYDLVITVDPQLGEVTRTMAKKYPGTRFASVDHLFDQYPANLKGLDFREDQAGFLVGALAGLMSESKTVGIVAGEENPAAKQFRNGYEAGVACVCPDCDVIGVYVNTETNSIQGRTAAFGQIGEGADVITGFGGAVGVGAIQGAAQDDAWAIGTEQDQYVTAFERGKVEGAKKLLSSSLKRADEAVYDAIQSLVSGSFTGGSAIYGVANNGVSLAPFHDTEADVTDDVKAALEEIAARLAQGTVRTGVNPVSGERIAAEAPEPGSCLLPIEPTATPSAP